jgi:hypothetical protein
MGSLIGVGSQLRQNNNGRPELAHFYAKEPANPLGIFAPTAPMKVLAVVKSHDFAGLHPERDVGAAVVDHVTK